jgi:hypothetical protein
MTSSSTATTAPDNWVPFDLAAKTKQLKNIGGGNPRQNLAALKALAITEATTNKLWAKFSGSNKLRVIIKKVPGAKP